MKQCPFKDRFNVQMEMKQCPFKHRCNVHIVTITKHIGAPPNTAKNEDRYLVHLPSALYERPGQNEKFVLNQPF